MEVMPMTAVQRDERAEANGGAPTLEFDRGVPYDRYVRASTLHTLQRTLSDDPGEMSFLMISQIMELYFGLIRYELRDAQRLLRDDDVWNALAPLRRAALHLDGLNAAWRGLRWMTPSEFNQFRDLLGEGSGFQSAMYRHLEFALGLKTESVIRPFRRQPEVHAELVESLEAPSLWDEVTALLERRGLVTGGEGVVDAWVSIYGDTTPGNHLRMLGEALADVAEGFGDWRYQHLQAVRRSMGAKAGSGGSAGLVWLERSMARTVFPELWTARTFI
ncbi:tryptophan 2,3-dioxygenase family protein [Nonomuraea sp. NPDC003804]|uniref:tryptophan 2,3-dioxygenase n=1 Tax=Nonomuraea sp. NPDC003804 TaxID=3154547 RepID=UPI0033B7505E